MSNLLTRARLRIADETGGAHVGIIVVAVLALGVISGIIALWGAQLGKAFWIGWRPAAPVLLVILVAIVLIVLAFVFSDSGSAPAILGTLAALAVVGAILLWVKLPYDTNRQYVADAKATTSTISYDQRAPAHVARESSNRNLQNTTGTAQTTKSLADVGKYGQWNTLVVRKGPFVGYETVQSLAIPLYGNVKSGDVRLCAFTPSASLRLGGSMPGNNLDRAVLAATPPDVTFDTNDVYSYCDGSTPKVVIPLKELDGWYAASWSAYGVAVYNGHTGKLRILKTTTGIPGPVYPLSLAETQRSAYNASGDFWDYAFGRSGYNDTIGDKGDPNGENATEFGLRVTGTHRINYVTPLTPRGDSSSVVALSSVTANTVTSGHRNPLIIQKYSNAKTRTANSAVAQNLKSQYSWMSDWASGMQIFEIVPSENGTWTASIGQSQSVSYRATIKADGSAVLYDQNGTEVTRTGVTPAKLTSGGTVPAAGDDLSKMTPAQLHDLAARVLDELASRAK